MNCRQCRGECVHGTPVFSRQESETYLACGEADVWVGNARFEADGGWGEGVVGRDFDVELPEAAFCFIQSVLNVLS